MGRSRLIQFSSPEETVSFGIEFAKTIIPGTVLALHGDLGVGKTTFVQGLAVGLGIHDPIQSPTFVYLNEYEGCMSLAHFDLYRLKRVGDFIDLGFEEHLEPRGVTVIEWPEKIESMLPSSVIHLNFSYINQGRTLEIY